MNPLSPLLGQQQIAGNTKIGTAVAEKALLGTANVKTLNPGNRVGVIGSRAGNWQSPQGGLSGEIAIPDSVKPSEYFTITIDTTNETEQSDVVLFDPKDLYQTSQCGSCASEKAIGGCVYSGSKDCDMYDTIRNMLCSKEYIIHTLRTLILDGNNQPGSISDAMATRFRIWQGNLNMDTRQTSFTLLNHISGQTYNNNIIDVPLSDQFSLLDTFTAWIVSVPPNTKMILTFFVAARN